MNERNTAGISETGNLRKLGLKWAMVASRKLRSAESAFTALGLFSRFGRRFRIPGHVLDGLFLSDGYLCPVALMVY